MGFKFAEYDGWMLTDRIALFGLPPEGETMPMSRIRFGLGLNSTLALLLVPLALFLAGETLQTLMLHSLDVRFVPEHAGAPNCGLYSATEVCAQLLKGEMLYAALWLLNVVAGLTALGVAISVIYNVMEQPQLGFARAVLLALVAGLVVAVIAAFLWSWLVWSALGWSNKYHLLLQAALGELLYMVPPFVWHGGALDRSLYLTTFILAIAGTFIAVGCALTCQDLPLPPAEGSETTDGPRIMAALSDRLQALKRVSLAGAVLLITGVLQGQFYEQLPIPYLQHANELIVEPAATANPQARPAPAAVSPASVQPNGGTAYKSYIDGMGTIQGIEFTLMLLGAFSVPALLIRHRAVQVAKLTAPKLTPPIPVTKYVQDSGFAFALPGYLTDMVTIAAPAIIGSLSPLIKVASFPS